QYARLTEIAFCLVCVAWAIRPAHGNCVLLGVRCIGNTPGSRKLRFAWCALHGQYARLTEIAFCLVCVALAIRPAHGNCVLLGVRCIGNTPGSRKLRFAWCALHGQYARLTEIAFCLVCVALAIRPAHGNCVLLGVRCIGNKPGSRKLRFAWCALHWQYARLTEIAFCLVCVALAIRPAHGNCVLLGVRCIGNTPGSRKLRFAWCALHGQYARLTEIAFCLVCVALAIRPAHGNCVLLGVRCIGNTPGSRKLRFAWCALHGQYARLTEIAFCLVCVALAIRPAHGNCVLLGVRCIGNTPGSRKLRFAWCALHGQYARLTEIAFCLVCVALAIRPAHGNCVLLGVRCIGNKPGSRKLRFAWCALHWQYARLTEIAFCLVCVALAISPAHGNCVLLGVRCIGNTPGSRKLRFAWYALHWQYARLTEIAFCLVCVALAISPAHGNCVLLGVRCIGNTPGSRKLRFAWCALHGQYARLTEIAFCLVCVALAISPAHGNCVLLGVRCIGNKPGSRKLRFAWCALHWQYARYWQNARLTEIAFCVVCVALAIRPAHGNCVLLGVRCIGNKPGSRKLRFAWCA